MTEVSPWPWPPNADGVVVLRPLLAATKQETVAYCRKLGQNFRRDSDNYRSRFTRNRVRRELLPRLAADYNPKVADALVRLSHTAALDLDFLERECDRRWPDIASELTDDPDSAGIRFDLLGLAALHPAMQRQMLRQGFVRMAGDARRLEERHLASFSKILRQNRTGASIGLPRGLWLHATYGAVVLSNRARLPCPLPTIEGEYGIESPNAWGTILVSMAGNWRIRTELVSEYVPQDSPGPDKMTAFFDAASLKKGIWVRTRQPGDRFQPLGMNVGKKLQDFFTDDKVPGDWRDRVPLMMSGQEIAWVVGHRIAEWAKVNVDAGAEIRPPVLRVEFSR